MDWSVTEFKSRAPTGGEPAGLDAALRQGARGERMRSPGTWLCAQPQALQTLSHVPRALPASCLHRGRQRGCTDGGRAGPTGSSKEKLAGGGLEQDRDCREGVTGGLRSGTNGKSSRRDKGTGDRQGNVVLAAEGKRARPGGRDGAAHSPSYCRKAGRTMLNTVEK